MNETGIKWLEARGLDPELAINLGWDTEGDWLKIPYLRGGKVVNHKYRGLAEKVHRQDKGGEKCLWNVDVLQDCDGQDVIITEGEFDALAAIQAGFSWVVSVPDGAPEQSLQDQDTVKYSFLDDETKHRLTKAKRVILATDNDDQGRALAFDLALLIGRARCGYLVMPRISAETELRCKDLNHVLKRFGPKGITETVERAQWWGTPSVKPLSDMPPRPRAAPRSWGVSALDKRLMVRDGDFSVWLGIPGHGKSAFLTHLACSWVVKHHGTICFASFEQEPQNEHKAALIRWYCDGRIPDETLQAEALGWINRHFVFVDSAADADEELLNLFWVKDAMIAAKVRYGASIFILDPWNEMDHIRDRWQSLTDYTGHAVKELKRLARELSMHLAVVVHPTKSIKEDTVPSLYDAADSAHFANKCDQGVVVYRDSNDLTQVYCRKMRYAELGKRGAVIPFEFSETTKHYTHAVDREDDLQGKLV